MWEKLFIREECNSSIKLSMFLHRTGKLSLYFYETEVCIKQEGLFQILDQVFKCGGTLLIRFLIVHSK